MLSKDKQTIQELLAHPGWELYKKLVLETFILDGKQRIGLKDQLQAGLQASARAGDQIKSASISGQIDILNVVLDVPNKFLKN